MTATLMNELGYDLSLIHILYKKLKEQGVQAKLLIHPDGNHSFELDLKDFLTIKYVERTVSFAKDLCE